VVNSFLTHVQKVKTHSIGLHLSCWKSCIDLLW